MAKLSFSAEDIQCIKEAINGDGNTWEAKALNDVKRKIKLHHREKQNDECCYCRRSTAGEFNLVIDIEHVLPKHRYKKYMFTMKNLSVACKRCNMKMKGQKIDSIVISDVLNRHPFRSVLYRLIHPNLDKYYAHISLVSCQINGVFFRKYAVRNDSKKGRFTYQYFKLEELEVNDADRVQGAEVVPELSAEIPALLAEQIRQILPDAV